MKRNKTQPKRWLIAIVLIIFSFSCVSIFTRIIKNKSGAADSDEIIIKVNESGEKDIAENNNSLNDMQSSELFPVYITGQVRMPGVYRVEAGQILDDLVKIAGGLTEEAAPDAVNLACELKSNQLYRIPSWTDLEENPDLYLGESVTEEEHTGKVNINTADQGQLETLPGIGPATATAIIKYREKNGNFETIEDIMLISGIKEARFRSLEDLITAD